MRRNEKGYKCWRKIDQLKSFPNPKIRVIIKAERKRKRSPKKSKNFLKTKPDSINFILSF